MKQIAMALLVSMVCAMAVAPAHAQVAREWTVMVFISGDDNKNTSLEESQVKNMDELSQLGSGQGYDIVVQVDRGNLVSSYLRSRYSDPDYAGAKRYHIERDKWVVHEKMGEVNMGDPQVLLDFMTWAAKTYPAKRYMLIANGHGSGILSWRGTGSVGDSRPGHVPPLALRQFVSYDDTNNDCLTVMEAQKVFETWAAGVNGGRKLDIFAADSCLSGTVEALYQLRDGVEYLIASESTVPGHGFAYTSIIRSIASNPGLGTEDLGEAIVKSFIDRATGDNVLGMFRTSAAEELVASTNALAREFYAAGKEIGKFAVQNLTAFSDNKYWDLGRIADSVLSGNTGVGRASNAQACAVAAQKVKDALRSSRASMWYSGSYAQAKVGGLSLLWPDKETYAKYRAFYKSTEFAKASTWDEFLDWRELGLGQ